MSEKIEARKLNPLVVILLAVGIFLGAASIVGLTYVYINHHTISVSPAEFEMSGESLNNPYCGWYSIYYYTLGSGENDINTVTQGYLKDRNRLALLEIDLSKYNDRALDDAAIADLNEIIRGWELSDKSLILRFLYDTDGDVEDKEPKEIAMITSHMDSIAPVVNAHKDSIYIVQGSFAGNFGEMHGGKFTDNANTKWLMDYLGKVLDKSVFLAVRTPSIYRTVAQTFEGPGEAEAYNGTMPSRLSLYNDGMMGSETDLGTYNDVPWSENRSYDTKGDRSQELTFQNELCNYVPNGGEAVVPGKYNDFLNALSALSTMHVSYLNEEYDEKVLKKWKLYTVQSKDAFNGDSGYDYIGKHLGYRYRVENFSAELFGLFSNEATVRIEVANDGYAPCYRPFTMEVTVVGSDNYTVVYSAEVPADTRRFLPGETSEAEFLLPIDELGKGTYTLYLKVTDPVSGETVKLGNVDPYEGDFRENYGLYLGKMGVDEG